MTQINFCGILPASFRDPSGFLFFRNKSLFRQINLSYKENYVYLMKSGLYKSLTDSGLLNPYNEVDVEAWELQSAYKIIKPEPIPFISYPYEWCFSQLKDAALLTLKVQKEALKFGMSLKDCSAYNIQFRKGKPIFIDNLSFEKYEEGKPWVGYGQFCQHFLAPLALMRFVDPRLNQLLRIYLDGIPLNFASSILPIFTRFNPFLFSHIVLHAQSLIHFANKAEYVNKLKMARLSFLALIDNLESGISKMNYRARFSEWSDYYSHTNYAMESFKHKEQLVSEFLRKINPKNVWDLGGNVGIFSRIASNKGIHTVSFDIDFNAVEKNYQECVKNNETDILPLLIDLTNPSPGLGWNNNERMSLVERGPVDTIFALAFIHHLAISNNLPLCKIADFFSHLCRSLIIEFIPKQDSQVQRLLVNRKDIFDTYTQGNFEKEFKKFFNIVAATKINHSERILYLMEKR